MLTLLLILGLFHTNWAVMNCYFIVRIGNTTDFLFEPTPCNTKTYPDMIIETYHCENLPTWIIRIRNQVN